MQTHVQAHGVLHQRVDLHKLVKELDKEHSAHILGSGNGDDLLLAVAGQTDPV